MALIPNNDEACESCANQRDEAEDRAFALEKERDHFKALLEEAHQSIESDHREQEIRRVHLKLDVLRKENKALKRDIKDAIDILLEHAHEDEEKSKRKQEDRFFLGSALAFREAAAEIQAILTNLEDVKAKQE